MADAAASDLAVITGLSEVAERYGALLVDVWGVLHNGRRPFAGAAEACARFRAERGPVVLISNSPQPHEAVVQGLHHLGMGDAFYDAVVTSGDATRAVLALRAPGPAFKLGPDYDDDLYEGVGLDFAPLDQAAFISCTGLFNDTIETPQDYRDRLAAAATGGLEMVCANPDLVVARGDQIIPCAGALAALYEELGGTVVFAGKPHPPIYDCARQLLAQAGYDPGEGAVLAIGDGPDTDLSGAQNEGLDALFIAGKAFSRELAAAGDDGLTRDAVHAFLTAKNRAARYAASGLRW